MRTPQMIRLTIPAIILTKNSGNSPFFLFSVITCCLLMASCAAFRVHKPHEYFPSKIQKAVEQANEISTKAAPAPLAYPCIDIRPWMTPDRSSQEEKDEVVREVLREATGAGSFNIIGHDVTPELLDGLVSSAERFFGQHSVEEKKRYSNGDHKAGYVAVRQEQNSAIHRTDNKYEQKDLREIYSMIYPPQYEVNVRGPDDFQEKMDEFIEQLQPVEVALASIFTAALTMAKAVDLPLSYLYSAEGGSTGLLRSSRYPAMPQEYDDAHKLLAHSDWSTLSILYAAEPGLEEIREGRWIDVPIEKGQLHVVIGELYAMWSNELFSNNIHRVSKNAVQDRVSFAYFFGQGQMAEGMGIEPVCKPDEVAKFPSASIGSHVAQYIESFIGKTVE